MQKELGQILQVATDLSKIIRMRTTYKQPYNQTAPLAERGNNRIDVILWLSEPMTLLDGLAKALIDEDQEEIRFQARSVGEKWELIKSMVDMSCEATIDQDYESTYADLSKGIEALQRLAKAA